jgi:uncharacterized protein YbjT (DUF2867 family)
MTTPVKTRRVFVTGATGYLGARLIPLLLERGHQVTALARPESVRKVPTGCQIVVGNPLESGTFVEQVRGADTFVQLVGVPKPAPWKGPQFRAIDGPSAMAAIRTAREAGVRHMVYVSVAHPAPIMRDYIAVRSECEAAITAAGLVATILRPWYILGPGHWWPLALQPVYRLMEQLPGTRAAALTVRFGDNSGDAHRR